MVSVQEWIQGLFDRITDPIVSFVDDIGEKVKSELQTILIDMETPIVMEIQKQLAFKSLDPSKIKDKQLREKVEKFKEDWKHSPSTYADIVNDILSLLVGQVAEVQFSAITGISTRKLDSLPITSSVFEQMGLLTDYSVLKANISEILETATLGQIDKMSDSLENVVNSSGVSQIIGFGYGQILNSVLAPAISQELNPVMRLSLLDPQSYISYTNRPEGINYDISGTLAKLGYDSPEQEILKDLYRYYPTANDLITFARRDIFNPKTVKFFGYDKEIPTIPSKYLKTSGLHEEELHLYWQSHWRDVERTDAEHLLHRKQITSEDYTTILKSANYPPNIIPKLEAISYSPYTRVDVRRMYAAGVLSKEEVLTSYQDIGYDEDKAQKLTDWTVALAVPEVTEKEKEASKSEILKSYTFGELTKADTATHLQDMGYSDETATFLITLQDMKDSRAIQEAHIKAIKDEYIRDIISQDAMIKELNEMNMSEGYKNYQKEILEFEKRDYNAKHT